MSKLAQAIVDEPASKSLSDKPSDSNALYLKQKKEAEIRMKLDEFARELTRAAAQRSKH